MPGGWGRREDEPPRAGQSLHAEYVARNRAWMSNRRRVVALSAAWWVPALALGSFIVGESTHFGLFGVLFFTLSTAAVLDVMFRRPASLVRVRDRATAESSTGRLLDIARIRGGELTIHDRRFVAGAEPFEVEHLVLSIRGAFLIDSKQWHGRKVQLLGGEMYLNQVDQAPVFKQLVDRARVIGEALTAAGSHDENVGVVTVEPMLAVHTDGLTGTPRRMHGVIVLTPAQLIPTLRAPAQRWPPDTVKYLAEVAEMMMPRKDRDT